MPSIRKHRAAYEDNGSERLLSSFRSQRGLAAFAALQRPMEIRIDDLSGPEIAALLSEHLECMAQVSPPESRHALNLDGLKQPGITFWTVWAGQELAGCGALKEIDPVHGEVKSMRTAKTHLRRGVASMLLQHIIAEAKRRGYGGSWVNNPVCKTLTSSVSVSKRLMASYFLSDQRTMITRRPFDLLLAPGARRETIVHRFLVFTLTSLIIEWIL